MDGVAPDDRDEAAVVIDVADDDENSIHCFQLDFGGPVGVTCGLVLRKFQRPELLYPEPSQNPVYIERRGLRQARP